MLNFLPSLKFLNWFSQLKDIWRKHSVMQSVSRLILFPKSYNYMLQIRNNFKFVTVKIKLHLPYLKAILQC